MKRKELKGEVMNQEGKDRLIPLWGEVPLLYPGDLFACPPEGLLQGYLCRYILKAETFHWGMISRAFPDQDDYGLAESLDKGTAISLMTTYEDRLIRIYRPRVLDVDKALRDKVAKELSYKLYHYGDALYDYGILPEVSWWFIMRKLGLKGKIIYDGRYYCQEYVVQIWKDFGLDLIPPDEYPISINLEKSPQLRLIYREF